MPRRETPLMFYGVVKGPTQGPDGAPACMAAGSDKAMLGVFFFIISRMGRFDGITVGGKGKRKQATFNGAATDRECGPVTCSAWRLHVGPNLYSKLFDHVNAPTQVLRYNLLAGV